jgi:hypothetical protein
VGTKGAPTASNKILLSNFIVEMPAGRGLREDFDTHHLNRADDMTNQDDPREQLMAPMPEQAAERSERVNEFGTLAVGM